MGTTIAEEHHMDIQLEKIGHGTRAVFKGSSPINPWQVIVAERHGPEDSMLRWIKQDKPGTIRQQVYPDMLNEDTFRILELVEHTPAPALRPLPRPKLVVRTAGDPAQLAVEVSRPGEGTRQVYTATRVKGVTMDLLSVAELLYGNPEKRTLAQWDEVLTLVGVPAQDVTWMAKGVFEKVHS